MGKYDKLARTLPSLPPDLSEHQQRINALKDEIRAAETHTPESLARAYTLARIGSGPAPTDAQKAELVRRLGKEGLEALLSEANKRVTALEQMLIESHDHKERGWGQYGAKPNAVRLPSGASVSVQADVYVRVEDKEKFRQWCVANGLENALQLWPSTTASITKERLLAGQSEPEGVTAHPTWKVVLRMGGGGEE